MSSCSVLIHSRVYACWKSGKVSLFKDRPDVFVYLQPVENSNRVKTQDEFLHGLVAAGCLCAVTVWPFCVPNLSVMQLCPEAACCLAPIISSSTSCNSSIHFFFMWGNMSVSYLPSTSRHWSHQPTRFCLQLCSNEQNKVQIIQKHVIFSSALSDKAIQHRVPPHSRSQ